MDEDKVSMAKINKKVLSFIMVFTCIL